MEKYGRRVASTEPPAEEYQESRRRIDSIPGLQFHYRIRKQTNRFSIEASFHRNVSEESRKMMIEMQLFCNFVT